MKLAQDIILEDGRFLLLKGFTLRKDTSIKSAFMTFLMFLWKMKYKNRTYK